MDALKNKEVILIVVAIIILVVGYFVYALYPRETAQTPTVQSPAEQNQAAAENVGSSVNDQPLENAPDLNPVNKANPFTSVKTNPFE
ncbi:MAG: hypothetical protein HY432_01955 [Candidatus Liptonbacteria bacterium]|nr:hypothetical protein [Candidatus Liptonbacteria bacterium]